ncbi:glycerophosphoryl diester phosphodiesterase membrane domain-containing protein [Streptomyces sp. bgisy159]|uniref:glycerophosphoryl diester phosphodiesterase membrane domain-containing protein n=1 Tax=Streptomyces sp. bgisy159 TaxID=3413795 RepID=UPI003F4A3329
MNDTPGWASPGSAPSDGQRPQPSGPAEPVERPDAAQLPEQPGEQSAGRSGAASPDPGSKWSKEQPPAGQWSAPAGPEGPGQAPTPPAAAGPGWGGPPPAGPAGGHGWGAPAGPGGYGPSGGPPGYGASGWGAGWGGPPPAAKPGVIPLRPLGVGEILDGAVSTMRTHWRTVLGISLTVAVVIEGVVVLLQGLVLNDVAGSAALNDAGATLDERLAAARDALFGSGAVMLITVIGNVIATALLTAVTSRAVLGRPVTVAEAWRDARPRLPRLFGLIALLVLILSGVLLVGALPGILLALAGAGQAGAGITALGLIGAFVVAVWLMVRLSLASPALMLEKQSIRKAMIRSAKLVRGSWWRVLGIQLLAAVIANLVAMIVIVPFSLAGAAAGDGGVGAFFDTDAHLGWTYLVISGIGSVIGSTITFPITAGVTVLLYIDQRIRREALDLDLARSAGVQNPGAAAAGPSPRS